jgi:hypothetical protein
MALVGSLSGSNGITALTGSLIPGSLTSELGSSSNKWSIVYASSVTGSIRKTSAGDDFIKAGPNITANYNTLGQWEITGAAGGGGESIFTAVDGSAAYTTSSIAVGFNAAASTKGSDVFFVVSGSTAGSNASLFAGPVVTSGSISVKDSGTVVAQITGPGVISGSGLQTVGNLEVQGTSALTGDVTFGGNIVADANEAKSIFALVTSNAITVGGAGSSVDVAGTLKVSGNQISGSAGGNITLQAAGDVVVAGDLTVGGNDIKSSAGSTAITLNGTDVTVAGDLTVTGNDIVFSAGAGNIATAATTLTIGSSTGVVVIPGDLEVQGTTMTVSASNLVIEDPLVGFGFLTGSTAGTSTGDRGFVGGYTGGGNSNVAFGYSLSNSAFVATKTNSNATATTFAVNDLQPIRASSFQVSGSTAELKGNGSTLQLSGTQLDVFAGSKGIILYRDGASYGDITGQQSAYLGGNGIRLSAGTTGYATALSGSTVWLTGDDGRVYVGRAANSGLLVSVNPGTPGTGAGGFVQLIAKQGEGAAPSLPMTLTGSSLSFSVSNSLTGISIQDTGTEFATISRIGGTAARLLGTDGLILSGTTATVQTSTGNITLRTAAATQVVNYNVTNSTYASIASGSYVGGGVDAVTLNNVARFSATNDLVLAAGGAGSVILSGSNSAYFNFGQSINFHNAGTGYLQILSGSTTSLGGTAPNVVKLEGRNSNGILLVPATGKNVHLSGSVELGGGTDNTIKFLGQVGTSIVPTTDVAYTLGTADKRWQHIYTGDLHLRNERGDYTLIEETDFLSIRFNKNGKRYKFLLERVPELDEPAR